MLTDAERAAIRERCENVTGERWGEDLESMIVTAGNPCDPDTPAVCVGDDPCNLVFIAHARTDVPKLLDEVERLRAALSQYDLCHCGHFRSAHSGHGHRIGTVEPTHCSQGCGCQEFGFYYPAGGVDFPDEFASQLRGLHAEPEESV